MGTDSGALHIIAKFELKALYSDRQFTIGLSICHISYNLQCNKMFSKLCTFYLKVMSTSVHQICQYVIYWHDIKNYAKLDSLIIRRIQK
jgi:hypothetical protein